MADMRILLVGNPNAGKSTLFNLITGGHAKVGNWHGVTVGVLERETVIGGTKTAVCDLPGIYSVDAMSMEEKLARDFVLSHGEDAILFVSECGSLDRSLPLFFDLVGAGRRAALVLTKRKRFMREGGKIDCAGLKRTLGVPVIDAEGKRKNALKEEIASALSRPVTPVRADVSALYTSAREGLSRADGLLLNGFFALPFFLILLLAAFFLTFAPRFPGDLMKNAVESLFSQTLFNLADGIASPVLRSFVQTGLLSSLGSVLCFLPQIALLYLFLILLEESGLLSRLAVLTDGFFARLGLNGRAVFSLLMGFGCTAAAILSTRGLDDKKIQRRVILALPYISCSAKLPVFLALSASFFDNPFVAVLLLYVLGAGISLAVALLLRPAKQPAFILELAPLQIPKPAFVLKSLLFQIKQFIIKVATVVLAFFLFSWLLSSFDFSFCLCAREESMLAVLCGGLKYLFAPIGMSDWRIAYAALAGLAAKENIAGALAMFYESFPYSAGSAFAFSVFILACSPCVSAIAASARELGWRRALPYALLQTASALLLSYLVYFALSGGALYLALAAAPVIALLISGKKNAQKLRRKRGKFLKRFHR